MNVLTMFFMLLFTWPFKSNFSNSSFFFQNNMHVLEEVALSAAFVLVDGVLGGLVSLSFALAWVFA